MWGPRRITWTGGGPVIGPPEPFSTMPMTWANAYGGIDWRVPVPGAEQRTFTEIPAMALRMQFDHPGMYPRNPVRHGLPGARRRGSGDVRAVPRGPGRPAHRRPPDHCAIPQRGGGSRCPGAWTGPARSCSRARAGSRRMSTRGSPRPTTASLPEVRRGFVGEDFHRTRCPGGTVDARFFQGASHGLVITPPRTGHVLSISGMHPDFELLEFRLPADRAENPLRDRRHANRPAGPAAPHRLPAERRATEPGVRRGVSAAACRSCQASTSTSRCGRRSTAT